MFLDFFFTFLAKTHFVQREHIEYKPNCLHEVTEIAVVFLGVVAVLNT